MICPHCDEKLPFDRDLKMSRLIAQDGMEVDLWHCPNCNERFANVLTAPWNVQYENEKGKTVSSVGLGYNHIDAFNRKAVRLTGWTLISGSRSSTYD